ncbi:MAG: hypothetical protein AAFX54_16460 [Pseudomonadota bacterium]
MSLANPLCSRKIRMSAGATDPAGAAAETGVAIVLADGVVATIAAREIMSAAATQGLAIINAAEMRTGVAIVIAGRRMANAAATRTDRVSGIMAMPAENAAMMALEMRNASAMRTERVAMQGGAMRPMRTDPAVKTAPLLEEGVATMAQETNSASVRPDGATNAGLTASVIDGALIVVRTGVGTHTAMGAVISAEPTVALIAVVTRIGMVVEINADQIAVPTVDAMHTVMGAGISADRIAKPTADGTPIETVAAINVGRTGATVAAIPIVRDGVISAVWIGDVIALAPTGIQGDSMAADISVMASVRGAATAISAAITTSSTITTAIILLAGSMRVSAGTFIQPAILAIAMWSPRLSFVAAAVFRRSPSFATTHGDTAI